MKAVVTIHALDLPHVQRVMLAALDLLHEVENADAALIPDCVTEAARKLRETAERPA